LTAPTPTPNAATTTRPERSSRRAARKSPLGWLPWALLGLLALLLAATLLVINAVDDDGPDGAAGDSLGQFDSNGSGLDGEDGDGQIAGTEGDADSSDEDDADAQPSADPNADSGAASGAGAGAAALTADGEDLLAASGGSLAAHAGQSVTGTATVESVVSDEGFWVGSSAQERVFVFLTPAARQSQGESGFQVTAGQTVQLSGALTALSEAPDAAEGITADEGRSQLDAQGAFISADAVTLA
jgi:hypothetical protein